MSHYRLRLAAALFFISTIGWSVHCGHRNPRFNNGFCSIGSEAFNYPMDSWIQGFRRSGGNRLPVHDGKGNGTAHRSLLDATCDMAPMTRPMNNAEVHALVREYGGKPIAVPVAVEALNIIVPRRSPVREITMEAVKNLFHRGPPRLRDALPVRGAVGDAPPELFGLNSADDRYRWFRTRALGGAVFSERVLETPGPLKLVNRVAASKAGFGYARAAESTTAVRPLPIRVKNRLYQPAGKNVDYSNYPLVRFYYIYLPPPGIRKPHPALAHFMRYVLSPAGQKALRPLGLYELSAEHRRKSLNLLSRALKGR